MCNKTCVMIIVETNIQANTIGAITITLQQNFLTQCMGSSANNPFMVFVIKHNSIFIRKPLAPVWVRVGLGNVLNKLQCSISFGDLCIILALVSEASKGFRMKKNNISLTYNTYLLRKPKQNVVIMGERILIHAGEPSFATDCTWTART